MALTAVPCIQALKRPVTESRVVRSLAHSPSRCNIVHAKYIVWYTNTATIRLRRRSTQPALPAAPGKSRVSAAHISAPKPPLPR